MSLWKQLTLLVLVTITFGVWSLVFQYSKDGFLHIYTLDVGQGDAIFIETPTGRQMLIDGGPGKGVLRSLQAVMPRSDRSIDVVMLTHPHYDHVAGLVPILDVYDVDLIVEGGGVSDSEVYKTFRTYRDTEDAEKVVLHAGDRLVLDDGVYFDTFLPEVGGDFENPNDTTIVGKLVFGDVSILFTGDAEKRIEARLLQSEVPLIADVLKVPHHGSRFSSNASFLSSVLPAISVISVGKNNYTHPHPEALGRLANVGGKIFRTDEQGTVHLVSDGEYIWVESE